MRRAENERLKEGEVADEELKKLKKDVKKKVSPSKMGSTKKKAGDSDEERVSPTHSQVDEKEEGRDDGDDDDDDVLWHTDTSAEAARNIQEQLSAATAEMVMLTTMETEKKANDTAKANGSPKKAVSPKPVTLAEELKASVGKGLTASQLPGVMDSLSGSANEKMDALSAALFQGTEKGLGKEVVKKKKYLAAALAHFGEGSQLVLLELIQGFFEVSNSVKQVALVLKALYDAADVLEEENVMQWYKKLKGVNKGNKIVKSAEPFIDWLQNAESETEEE